MKKIIFFILLTSLLSVFALNVYATGDELSGETSIELCVIWGIIIGLVVSGITVGTIIIKYKTKLKAPIYPLSNFAKLNLIASRDTFLGKTVTRVRVANSNKRKR